MDPWGRSDSLPGDGPSEVLISGEKKCAADPNWGDFLINWDPLDPKMSPGPHLSYSGWPAVAPRMRVFTMCKHRLLAVCTAAPPLRTQASRPTWVCLGGPPGPARALGSAPSSPGRRPAAGTHQTPGRGKIGLFWEVPRAWAGYHGMESAASGGWAVDGPHAASFRSGGG